MPGEGWVAETTKPTTGSGTGSAAAWKFAWATQIGSLHLAKGEPREDAASVEPLDGLVVATVADGHGMRRAFRAEIGSELAVLAVRQAAQVDLSVLVGGPDVAALDWLRSVFTDAVVEGWRTLVTDHADRHPITPAEVRYLSPAESSDGELHPEAIWLSYGCTVLTALATPSRVLVWQIGDGDIIAGRPGEPGGRVVPDDPWNHGNSTSSICQPDAASRARAAVLAVTTDPLVVVLATDGFGNAMAAEDWRTKLSGDLLTQMADRGFESVATDLPRWAATCSTASGDDVSVIVLASEPTTAMRSGDDERAALPAPEPVPITDPPGTPPRVSLSRWVLGLGGALILALGGGLGYVVGNRSAAPQPVPATASPQGESSQSPQPTPTVSTRSATPIPSVTGGR